MIGNKTAVNLGLVSLPLGDERRDSAAPCASNEASAEDVARLRALLGDSAHAGAPASPDPGGTLPHAELERTHLVNDEAALAAAQLQRERVGEALALLCRTENPGCGRVLRLNLHADILPDTVLQMVDTGACLHIDLEVGCAATRQWLASKLPELTEQLGQRLQRPLRLSVGGEAGQALVREWPPGAPA